MHLKRIDDAQPYEAPYHFGCHGLRRQGFEEGGPDSTPFEKVYVLLEGEMPLTSKMLVVIPYPPEA